MPARAGQVEARVTQAAAGPGPMATVAEVAVRPVQPRLPGSVMLAVPVPVRRLQAWALPVSVSLPVWESELRESVPSLAVTMRVFLQAIGRSPIAATLAAMSLGFTIAQ